MIVTQVLRAAGRRTPLIQFLGKRSIPESIDHTPRLHPQDPHGSLPKSFAEYRAKAQQHGPLTGYRSASSGGKPSIQPKEGEHFDRNELPRRFWRLAVSKAEMEAIETGAAYI
ncbi:hypothetical protein BDZ91DRAFT_711122 [Kalaharituber pfeilii]|nr:hypothetical protein BDZ91DRAFT_711122 [Kalaharituber pfeilii]